MRLVVCSLVAAWAVAAPVCAESLPPWTPGTLDIHQIATGRGNSALIVCPDGTSIMIDAGASNGSPEVSSPPRPDGSRRPGEWIGRYALRQLRATGGQEIDYFIATHLHPDHVGDVGPGTPQSPEGDFFLTGLTDVAAVLPIRVLVDRGYPDYDYPTVFPAPFALNYRAYVSWRRKLGAPDEQLAAGRSDQIILRHNPRGFPAFVVRNIAANGVVWSGTGDTTQTAVPALSLLAKRDYPDENMCSVALRLSYGAFDYFTGGDLACSTAEETQVWRDVETPAARATGPVEVAVANHHGYFDAVGAEAVRALQPQVWVVPAWHVTHPGIAQLERMLSDCLYPGPREIFITNLTAAAALLNQRFLPRVGSVDGHIVVRVEPGGERFRVFVTENRDESDAIKATFGPYQSR